MLRFIILDGQSDTRIVQQQKNVDNKNSYHEN